MTATPVRPLLAMLTLAFVGACSQPNQESAMQQQNSASLTHQLRVLSQARILLGHQSVGRDLLAGLELLAGEANVPLHVEEIDGVPAHDGPGIFHSNIGRNGDPESKCEVFSRLLDRPERPEYDLAMMKFCYVDLGRDTPLEVAAMLERYSRMVESIREARPDVQLVHITLPLMADPPGKKTMVKRMIGMATHRDADNLLRNAFNDALRQRFSGEPMFDLASAESTLPDGSRSAFSADGRQVYTLAQRYTPDGGHLNDAGRRHVAAEFVKTLAAALPEGG